jgi:xanthine dehydrogenase accessory factor
LEPPDASHGAILKPVRELLTTLDDWATSNPVMALATVVRTAGSTPRSPGARLLVSRDGRMAGSVSGGCLESAVIQEAQATLAGEAPPRILRYGISDELGWEVGLACGGSMEIFVETLRWDGSDPALVAVQEAVHVRHPVALLSVVTGEHVGARAAADEEAHLVGTLGDRAAESAALTAAASRLTSALPGIENVSGLSVFIDPIVAAPQLVIVGAVEIAIHLARLAKTAGYRIVVIDPRRAFLTEDRIPDADLLIPQWPDEALPALALGPRDAAVCLAHDPKFEDPALGILLRSRVGYVGAIGSRSTHAKRVTRLQQEGLDALAISRIHSPIGLDLGAATPQEIALAILAEVVAARRGRPGGALSPTAPAARP